MMISGIVLTKIGRIYRYSSRWGALELSAPRLALIPDSHGGVGGAAATLDFHF